MASPIRSTMFEIAAHVRTRLADWLVAEDVLPSDHAVQITVSDPEDVPHFTADREFLIWPREERARLEYSDGGGRWDTRSTRGVGVVVRTRLELDEAGFDPLRLTQASAGHLLMEANVKDALQEFMPTGDGTPSGDTLTDQPLVWTFTQPPRNEANDRHWVYSVLFFDVNYWDDVEPTDENFGSSREEED